MKLRLFKKQFTGKETAQSAAELAVFGAIFVYVVSLIIRGGMSQSQAMNAQLQAMRYAMSESLKTSMGRYGKQSTSRNSAGILLIEDRLSIDAGQRLESRDRIPYIVGGTGVFTNSMFMPIDSSDVSNNVPLYDMIINGQRFVFTTAGVRVYTVDYAARTLTTDKGEVISVPHCPNIGADAPPYGLCIDTNCYTITIAPPTGSEETESTVQTLECLRFPVVVGNYPASTEWCSGISPTDGSIQDCEYNLYADERFDLDFDGSPDVSGTCSTVQMEDCTTDDPPVCTQQDVTQCERQKFMWQWTLVLGLRINNDTEFYQPTITNERFTKRTSRQRGDNNTTTGYDIDGDLREELIVHQRYEYNGRVLNMWVLDSQEGDLDFTYDDKTRMFREKQGLPDLEQGLKQDVLLFTFTTSDPGSNQGTYLRIEEGKLFSPLTNQFVRSASRKDSADVIQRLIQLNRDTDRFCDANGDVTDWITLKTVKGLKNPVERCNECMSQANLGYTCFDETSKLLYVRSRIRDLRGRRWITRLNPAEEGQ